MVCGIWQSFPLREVDTPVSLQLCRALNFFAASAGCFVHGWDCSCWKVRSPFGGNFNCSSLSSCSTYNYTGRLNNRLFSAFKTNNMDGARLEMRRSQASIKLLSKYGESQQTDTIIFHFVDYVYHKLYPVLMIIIIDDIIIRPMCSIPLVLFHPLKTHAAGGGVSVGREFMRLQGVDCGPPRLPLLRMTPDTAKNLESDLKDMGFFEWA